MRAQSRHRAPSASCALPAPDMQIEPCFAHGRNPVDGSLGLAIDQDHTLIAPPNRRLVARSTPGVLGRPSVSPASAGRTRTSVRRASDRGSRTPGEQWKIVAPRFWKRQQTSRSSPRRPSSGPVSQHAVRKDPVRGVSEQVSRGLLPRGRKIAKTLGLEGSGYRLLANMGPHSHGAAQQLAIAKARGLIGSWSYREVQYVAP